MDSFGASPAFIGNAAALNVSILECERSLGFAFPADYVQFQREHNGGEGFVGKSYLMLWKFEEIEAFNREYEVAEYCPGFLLFGSSGGGEAYAFDTRSLPWKVVEVPFVGMDYSLTRPVADNFQGFLDKLKNGKEVW